MSAVVDLFIELARVPSPSGNERAVADLVIGYLRNLGLDIDEDATGPLVDSTIGNLYLRLPGTCPGVPVFLCAHLDTVPPVDRIEPVISAGMISNEADAILGGDNKAAVAVMLEALRLVHEQERPHAGIELVLTSREETGLAGASAFDAGRLHARNGYVFDQAAPIGEIVLGAPSIELFEIAFRGRASHAGMFPRDGRSAIHAAARAVGSLRVGSIDDETTANVGTISGGTAVNVVPELCLLTAEVRSHDEKRLAEVVAGLREAMTESAREAECEVDIAGQRGCTGYQIGEDEPVVRLAVEALTRLGHDVQCVRSGGASDANVFNELAGVRCLNLANGMVDIHTPQERIAADDLDQMLDVTLALVEAACARAGG